MTSPPKPIGLASGVVLDFALHAAANSYLKGGLTVTHEPTHHALSAASSGGGVKLIRRIRKLLGIGRSSEVERVRVQLDVLRPDPVEAPFNDRAHKHSLIDDNPASG
jgi:hypothetical protein